MIVSSDNAWLVSGGIEKNVSVWDLTSKRLRTKEAGYCYSAHRTMKGHNGRLNALILVDRHPFETTLSESAHVTKQLEEKHICSAATMTAETYGNDGGQLELSVYDEEEQLELYGHSGEWEAYVEDEATKAQFRTKARWF